MQVLGPVLVWQSDREAPFMWSCIMFYSTMGTWRTEMQKERQAGWCPKHGGGVHKGHRQV